MGGAPLDMLVCTLPFATPPGQSPGSRELSSLGVTWGLQLRSLCGGATANNQGLFRYRSKECPNPTQALGAGERVDGDRLLATRDMSVIAPRKP